MSFEIEPNQESDRAAAIDLLFLQQVMQYQDGTLTPEAHAAFEKMLIDDSTKLRTFADLQLQTAAIREILRHQVFVESGPTALTTRAISRLDSSKTWGFAIIVAITLLVAAGLWWLPSLHTAMIDKALSRQMGVPRATKLLPAVAPEPDVFMAGSSQASFFGELTPKSHRKLEFGREYVLTGGLVEISFPAGATAIVEAPAVFRILTGDCLAMDTGRCSVHAPDGAEGFRVETPATRVVDRGTRFIVNVSEGIETEVQVIEGIADVYRKPDLLSHSAIHENRPLPLEARLEHRDARRFSGAASVPPIPATFSPEHYLSRLPDRIISYEATEAENGGVEDLLSVTVQRRGEIRKYPVAELISVELTGFKSYETADRSGHLAGAAQLPPHRRHWLADPKLNTGVINPGGQQEPLQSDPVVHFSEDPDQPNTPGLAVHFQSPVTNSTGPDVVFFELQTLANPPQGDAFHVSPLHFEGSRRSLTVRSYDLTLSSPEVRKLANFYLYQFPRPVASLEKLDTMECPGARIQLGFRVLATGIDLSDLGFADGEHVQDLFFQDADDDMDRVDPVFIAGLPTNLKK